MNTIKKILRNILVVIARKILSKELAVLEKAIVAPQVQETVVVKYQMPSEVFEREIVGKLPRQLVNSTTTDLQAAALVGQQQVIDLLRNSSLITR